MTDVSEFLDEFEGFEVEVSVRFKSVKTLAYLSFSLYYTPYMIFSSINTPKYTIIRDSLSNDPNACVQE